MIRNTGGDKLSRLAGHIISQQCYSPLWPAPQPVDAALWAAYAQLPCTPHVLVLPSNFRYFVKVIASLNVFYCYSIDIRACST